MEAVPKLPLISFELKTSPENTHFGAKLKQYIADAYREDPESYSNEIHQLESLRSAAVRPSNDQAGLSAMYRYFCQLRAIQSRFPMAKGQPVAVNFIWRDIYSNMNCTGADIRFEMACILHNIGALHTELGASEPRTSPESLKSACTHFQHAAWAFQFIREQYPQPGSGVDICSEVMLLLQEICFAQAQECILEKSIQDTRKPSVIGAVATQVMFFYKNALAHLGPSGGADTIHEMTGTRLYNYWHRYLSFKKSYVGCIVSLYQGMNSEEQQKMGERVAFYQQAVDKLTEARKLAKYIEPVKVTLEALTFTNDVVEGKRKAAKNENEFIYHEEVPEKDLLLDMKPVCLVKALPIDFNDPEVSGPDVFSRLIPMGAHEASSVYSEEKAKLLRQVVSQVDAKNAELTEFMSSLQLDQLEVLDADQKIPQEIVDRCAAMNAKPEVIQTLSDSMNNLAEIISDVEESLAEIKALIQEETLKEKDYQKIMGPRPPSIVQTELSREFHKYQEAHARTNESNQVLHKAMTLHIANLRQLAQPLEQLQTRIPTIDNIEDLDRASMGEMRRVVGKAREMQTQRDSLVAELRAAVAADDVTARLLARAAEPRDQLFAAELAKHEKQVKIIEMNLAAQEKIINKLTSLYASYGESRRMLADLLRKREGIINALITSYDTYTELLAKCQKGLEFYKKLAHNVGQLLSRLRSTCHVQADEREALLAKHNKGGSPAASPARAPGPAPAREGAGLKLKDYLPYMKKRNTQPEVDSMPPDTYYPESIYPTSVRPAPVGSEADPAQIQLPDGIVMPQTSTMPSGNPYARYAYGNSEIDAYSLGSNISYTTTKSFEKIEENPYGYSTYTPTQYSQQMTNPQTYAANPYYSATQDSPTVVTDSQNASPYTQNNQANASNSNNVGTSMPSVSFMPQNIPSASHSNMTHPIHYNYDIYGRGQITPIPEVSSSNSGYSTNSTDLTANFAQIQLTPKDNQPGTNPDYSKTYYSTSYPQAATPNMATYSNAEQDSNTVTVRSAPTLHNMVQYPYGNEAGGAQQPHASASAAFAPTSDLYSYASSQGFTLYVNNDAIPYSSTAVSSETVFMPCMQDQNPALSPMDAYDQPIKSHVTGEALSYPGYQGYEHPPYSQPQPNPPAVEAVPSTTSYYQDPPNVNYAQVYQNHPGYNYNAATGTYDYSYGSQNTYMYENQTNVEPQPTSKDPNWNPQTVYTSAGACETVQSPSETPQAAPQPNDNQTYYNSPYGYITNTNQANQAVPTSEVAPTNYGADVNQSTYMQSGQPECNTVTYTNNQVMTPKEEIQEPTFGQKSEPLMPSSPVQKTNTQEESKQVAVSPEQALEPTAFDLLSDIDFTVVQKPLMPDIKVPQISESAIKKPLPMPKVEPVVKPVPKEQVISRPAKRDLFSDPSLLNSFTQEVKNLQSLVDSLTNKTPSGLTLLDAKWKTYQDLQSKENMTRTKSIAMQYCDGNIVTAVAPYDDSRLQLKSDPDAYINASYYKQLAPWCIPLIISSIPEEHEHGIFWKAVLENKISCVVCLLSEIEMQGKTHWPTAMGQALELPGGTKVVLEEVVCTVHWTERKLAIALGNTRHRASHFQINVFPAKIVCSPLVMLVDKILNETFDNRLSNQLSGAWLQCRAGGGRCALLALLTALVCQVRAGQLALRDTLDSACANLYKHRTNVLEDTKYLVDTYRTALFYVQGVLCSGTTTFNGEAISVPTGASVLPPVTPTPTAGTSANQRTRFSRESFEEMKQSPGLKTGDMKDPLNFLDPLWSLKKK